MTRIEWADETWNPITGCSPISEGCQNCYAQRMAQRLKGRYGYDKDEPFRVTLHEDKLDDPFGWKKPRRVFVCSMGDLFHKNVRREWTARVLDAAFHSYVDRGHTMMFLTKRPERMREELSLWGVMRGIDVGKCGFWLGVTVENDNHLWRIEELLKIKAAVRFVSIEPMLGPVYLKWALRPQLHPNLPCLDWVIVGGETGPGARPMQSDWARSVRDQCEAVGVPFFFKKHGNWWCKQFNCRPEHRENGELDGQEWNQFPEVK